MSAWLDWTPMGWTDTTDTTATPRPAVGAVSPVSPSLERGRAVIPVTAPLTDAEMVARARRWTDDQLRLWIRRYLALKAERIEDHEAAARAWHEAERNVPPTRED